MSGFARATATACRCSSAPCSISWARPAAPRTRISRASGTSRRCARPRDHLDAAAAHVATAPPPIELFAEELRGAQQALAAITGEFTADDLLGAIFGRFCIGK